jgi:hypothetical protein
MLWRKLPSRSLTIESVRTRAALVLAFAALAPAVLAGAEEPVRTLRLVDDRGAAVPGLSACFQVELATQCAEAGRDGTVPLPPSFAGVRAEGPHHGPVSARERDLRPEVEGGPPVLRVPRKAFLQIDGLPAAGGPLTVEVFRVRAPSFRNPVFRGAVTTSGLEIPAGELVVALSARGRAPDLHRLSAPPAGRVRLAYQPRDGWSLVVRCREAVGGKPVGSVAVSVGGQKEATGADGLVLFSGLAQTTEEIEAVHPRFLPQAVDGSAAEPGTISFREVALERGGSVRARITFDGAPAEGAFCAILDVRREDDGPRVSHKLFDGMVGADGLCRTGRLAVGSYVLRVSVPQSRSFSDQPVTVREGEDAEVAVALTAIRVSGRVFRAGRPAMGYTVEAVAEGQAAGSGLPSLHAVTDPEGEYHATVWSPGAYTFHLRSPAGAPVAGERRVDLGRAAESVDFDLGGASFVGRVVDDHGAPVEGAQVTLRWPGGGLAAQSGANGAFEIQVAEEGSGELTAAKPGYEPSVPRRVTAGRAAGAVPVTLMLRRAQ